MYPVKIRSVGTSKASCYPYAKLISIVVLDLVENQVFPDHHLLYSEELFAHYYGKDSVFCLYVKARARGDRDVIRDITHVAQTQVCRKAFAVPCDHRGCACGDGEIFYALLDGTGVFVEVFGIGIHLAEDISCMEIFVNDREHRAKLEFQRVFTRFRKLRVHASSEYPALYAVRIHCDTAEHRYQEDIPHDKTEHQPFSVFYFLCQKAKHKMSAPV